MYIKNDAPPRRILKEMPAAEWPTTRLTKLGPGAVSLAELLAIILNTKDALDLATELLTQFKTLANIQRATITELQQLRGVGKGLAIRIKATIEIGKRLAAEPLDEQTKVDCSSDAANIFMPMMRDLEQEHLIVMSLNTKRGVIDVQTLYVGSLDTSVIRVGEIFRVAIRNNAAAIIIAHNHPSGDPSPSPEDIHVTRQIVQSGQALDITVLDHMIIGHNRYVSLKEKGAGF